MGALLVQEFLENSADRLPEKTGLICDGLRLTYAEIESRANRLANALISCGLKRGERVVFCLPNSVELVIGIFAVLKAGGVFVVVNVTTKHPKLAYILNNSQAACLVVRAQDASLAVKAATASPALRFVIFCRTRSAKAQWRFTTAGPRAPVYLLEDILENSPASRPPKVNISLDLACLIYTSGSTGEAKGVMSDHSNMIFAANSIISYIKNVEDDVVICVLPLSFDYGLYQLLMVFQFGGTLVLERSFTYPAEVLKRMETERVTGFPGVPTIFTMLLKMDLAKYDLSALRYITNTAAALPPSHIRQLRDKFPSATLYSMYGLTETKRTLYLPPDELDRRPDSVGIAIPGTEVWIENEEGKRLGPGEVGELVVRGQHVMRGYWGDPKATAARYRPGPLPGERVCYTGDLFHMDEDGFYYFVGRKDDIIKSAAEKVAPKEVENVLYDIEGVEEAAVIGVPDPVLGQAIKAYIVSGDPRLDITTVLAHCRANLESFMVPKYVEFCQVLPKTTSGKIQKSKLK